MNITVYVPAEDYDEDVPVIEQTFYTESEADDIFAESVCEISGPIQILGTYYDAAQLLRDGDPVTYRVMASDYFSDHFVECEMDWSDYLGTL